MEQMKTSTGVNRFEALDSIRGIASLAVLLGHTLAVFNWDIRFYQLFLFNNFFDGRSAVTMFFVLSGFVLTVGYLKYREKKLYLVPFFARRVTRIWVPWLAFFIISLFCRAYLFDPPLDTVPRLTEHHQQFWSSDCSNQDIIKQLIYSLRDNSKALLPQDWSLGVEMKSAIFIPIFLILAKKSGIALLIASLLLTFIIPATGYYYTSFGIGVLTALAYCSIQKYRFKGWLICLLGLVLYQIRWVYTHTDVLGDQIGEKGVWLLSALGCGFILYGVVSSTKLQKFLEIPCLSHLGRVSYSLYLVQVIILMCLAPWIMVFMNVMGIESDGWKQILLLISVVGVSLILSHFGERYIEIPCVKLGRAVTGMIKKYSFFDKFRV